MRAICWAHVTPSTKPEGEVVVGEGRCYAAAFFFHGIYLVAKTAAATCDTGLNYQRFSSQIPIIHVYGEPMTKTVLLDNINHRDLKVITRYSAEFGDSVNQVQTFPTEFGDIQREYPIFFRKDPKTGEFQAIALLGFDKNENLFLDETGAWDASYIPAILARGPFMIGFQEQKANGERRHEPMMHVDLDNPRISKTEGQPVFLPHGGNSPYLEHVSAVLRCIYEGMAASRMMFDAFESMDLIEPVKVEFRLSDTEQYTASQYYTINQDKLAQLDGEKLEKLNKAGLLRGAFLVITSLANVPRLIDLKNRKRAGVMAG
jgi:hypothetical protein